MTRDGVHLLFITKGQLYVGPNEGTHACPTLIETGDVLLTTRGLPYRVQYPLDVPAALEASPRLVQDSSKSQADEIEWMRIAFQLDVVHGNLLTEFLPYVIHLKKAISGLTAWLKRTVALFLAEHRTLSQGRGAVLSRLAEIVLRAGAANLDGPDAAWIQGMA